MPARDPLVFNWAVCPGSEKLDIGDKRVACLCTSEEQARHMAAFWGPYGYYERTKEVDDARKA